MAFLTVEDRQEKGKRTFRNQFDTTGDAPDIPSLLSLKR
jgi:hypothetical protein